MDLKWSRVLELSLLLETVSLNDRLQYIKKIQMTIHNITKLKKMATYQYINLPLVVGQCIGQKPLNDTS